MKNEYNFALICKSLHPFRFKSLTTQPFGCSLFEQRTTKSKARFAADAGIKITLRHSR